MTEPLETAVARYLPQGKFAEGFARGKMKGDPAYAAVLQRLKPGMTLVDAGCGEGYLLALAHATYDNVGLYGFDHDDHRLRSAQLALEGTSATLWAADARVAAIPNCDALCALDVLHYQPPDEQDAMLARFAEALRPGGWLMIRDGRSDAGMRSLLTLFAERLAVGLGRHKGDGVFFRPMEELRAALENLGLEVTVDPCHEGTPFANQLFLGRKP